MILFIPPIRQYQWYQRVADRRSLRQLIPSFAYVNVPNVLNVLSNIPLIFIGTFGILLLLSSKNIVLQSTFEQFTWIIFFICVTLTSICSSYYHFRPTNRSPVWNHFPISIGFSSLVALLIDERINPVLSRILFPFLIISNFTSCIYWYCQDDLRSHLLIQFFPMIYIPLLLLISSSVYSQTSCYVYACFLCILAQLSEIGDKQIFRFTSKIISGHTLKHILSACGFVVILYMLKVRVIL
ncbi:unnamed protein product [Adineta ricciae]|uniref:Alkaline phytoceramidase n=1 Tax=Adineta ricciae TaxID=249248 RepID=A0A815JFY1_ADIRI|nr:unnamed protein product [Adineta ricciae]